MAQRRQLFGRRRRDVGGPEPIGCDEPGGGEGDAGLLDELAHGRGSRGERRIAEPSLRVRRVAGIDRPAGERDVAGQEAALRAASHDEHLGLAVAVGAHTDHRRGATDGSLVHGAHPRRSTPYCVRGKRSGRRDPNAHPRRGPRHVRDVHGARTVRAGRVLRRSSGGRRRRLRDEPARASRVRHVPRTGAARSLADAARLAGPAAHHRGGRRRRDARPPDPRRARRLLHGRRGERGRADGAARDRRGSRSPSASPRPSMWWWPTSSSTTCRSDSSQGGREVLIGLEGEHAGRAARRARRRLSGLLAGIDDNRGLVVPVGILGFIDELAASHARLRPADRLRGRVRAAGPAHGYREHRIVEDVLAAPGHRRHHRGRRLRVGRPPRRAPRARRLPLGAPDRRLLALGFESWLRGELAHQQEQLADGRGLEAVRTWSARSRASLLVDPAALGRMRWLLLATPESPGASMARRAHGPKDRLTFSPAAR